MLRRITYRLLGNRREWYRDRVWRRLMDTARRRYWVITPIDTIFRLLELKGLLPSPVTALEVFGRHGLWKTVEYAHRCAALDHYEINPGFASQARHALPKHVNVVCADSVGAVRGGKTPRRDYNLIFIDGWPGCFGDSYCEHFDLFPAVYGIMGNECVLAVAVYLSLGNTNFAEIEPRLLERRREFYGLATAPEAMNVSLATALEAYRRTVPAGFELRDEFVVPHPGETVWVVLCLRRASGPQDQ